MTKFKIGDKVRCIEVENENRWNDFPGAGWAKDREFIVDNIWGKLDKQGACYSSDENHRGVREGALELVINYYETY